MKAIVAALSKRVAELELALAKANKDSSTSSKPPSSDITKPKRARDGGKRRIGGQLGRQRTLREPLSQERVDETIKYEIETDAIQRLGLTPTGDFDVIQHIELPEKPLQVIIFRG